jgi:pimeloyl-ACP methyl ester carboxylesterase
LDITTDVDGFGQVTAILRAGERFLGTGKEVSFEIRACILDGDICGKVVKLIPLKERKTPVVLIHGLWANPDSFMKHPIYSGPDAPTGLFEFLKDKGYLVAVPDYCQAFDGLDSKFCHDKHNYPDDLGPSVLMTKSTRWLKDYINKLCGINIDSGFACTRVDLVGHSMGGLMSRAFIQRNKYYWENKTTPNYKQGAVRRLITISTPHVGSGIPNLLKGTDYEILNGEGKGCIRTEKKIYEIKTWIPGEGILPIALWYKTGREIIDDFIIGYILDKAHKRVGSAITDLQLAKINPRLNLTLTSDEMTKPLGVPIFAYYGDIGNDKIAMDLEEFASWLPGDNNKTADNILEYLTGCRISDLFHSENSDGIVPVSSSKWNGYIPDEEASGKYLKKVTHEHTGMGKDPAIMEEVEKSLSAPLSEFYIK